MSDNTETNPFSFFNDTNPFKFNEEGKHMDTASVYQ